MKVTSPVNPAVGTNTNGPSEENVKVPSDEGGPETMDALPIVTPLLVSLARTPAVALTLRVVFRAVE